jgi:hypothetical protein
MVKNERTPVKALSDNYAPRKLRGKHRVGAWSVSLVLCVCFLDICLSICPFSFGHCVVCPLIYDSDYCLRMKHVQ